MRMIGRKDSQVVVHTGVDDNLERLDHYLNAKAALGWRLHSCDRIEHGSYFVVMDRFNRSNKNNIE